jgi:hypothetical protein
LSAGGNTEMTNGEAVYRQSPRKIFRPVRSGAAHPGSGRQGHHGLAAVAFAVPIVAQVPGRNQRRLRSSRRRRRRLAVLAENGAARTQRHGHSGAGAIAKSVEARLSWGLPQLAACSSGVRTASGTRCRHLGEVSSIAGPALRRGPAAVTPPVTCANPTLQSPYTPAAPTIAAIRSSPSETAEASKAAGGALAPPSVQCGRGARSTANVRRMV